jgi:colanic acid biosynthesis glycosyl transferase WcaI
MRLIFINRFGAPDHSATSQILSDLTSDLSARGFPAHIITSRQRYDDPEAALPSHDCINGVELHRVWTARFGRDNLALRFFDYLTFYFTANWRLWRLARPGDVIVVMTDPPLFSVAAAPIARLRGCRLVNWLQDVFPEAAEALGVGGRIGRLFFKPLRLLRNLSLKAAHANVVLGDRMATHMRSEGAPSDTIIIIPNWSDGALVTPVPRNANALRDHWGLNGQFVVGYSGNLGRAHEFDAILEAMTLLQEGKGVYSGGQDIMFLFIGGGALRNKLRQEAAKRGLRNFRAEEYQPANRLAESLSAPDVHLVSLRPEFEGLIVPSKLYGVLAAGRPALFIGDSDGEASRVLRSADCGVSVAPGDGASLALNILELSRSAERRLGMGERARAAFDARFERNIAIESWVRFLTKIFPPAAWCK